MLVCTIDCESSQQMIVIIKLSLLTPSQRDRIQSQPNAHSNWNTNARFIPCSFQYFLPSQFPRKKGWVLFLFPPLFCSVWYWRLSAIKFPSLLICENWSKRFQRRQWTATNYPRRKIIEERNLEERNGFDWEQINTYNTPQTDQVQIDNAEEEKINEEEQNIIGMEKVIYRSRQ